MPAAHDLSEFVDVAGKALIGLGTVVKIVKELAKRLAEAKPQGEPGDEAYIEHLKAEVEQRKGEADEWRGMYLRLLDKYEGWTARDRGVQLEREIADEAEKGADEKPGTA